MSKSPQEIKDFLIGKTISNANCFDYMGETRIEQIDFSDGSSIQLGGNCDFATAELIQYADGNEDDQEIECQPLYASAPTIKSNWKEVLDFEKRNRSE
jgi:hypothetical protein